VQLQLQPFSAECGVSYNREETTARDLDLEKRLSQSLTVCRVPE
jgi:hypothetical protein